MENEYKKINEAFDKVIESIQNGDVYKKYILLKEQMKKHEKINSMIKEIKNLQKQAVKKESQKLSSTEEDDKIKELLEELNQIPLYQEFTNTQKDLDEELLLVKTSLNNYIENIDK